MRVKAGTRYLVWRGLVEEGALPAVTRTCCWPWSTQPVYLCAWYWPGCAVALPSSLVDLLHLTCESGGPHIKLWLWGESPTATVVAAPVVAAPVVGADPLHGLSAETGGWLGSSGLLGLGASSVRRTYIGNVTAETWLSSSPCWAPSPCPRVCGVPHLVAAAPAGTGSSSPSTSSDPGRPQTTIAAITEYLAGLALGARRQTEEYGTFMGSPRLYNLVEGGKVARIQAMAKVCRGLWAVGCGVCGVLRVRPPGTWGVGMRAESRVGSGV